MPSGRGCALARTNTKNAFRLILVSPSDYNLLGICWRDRFYVDRILLWGFPVLAKYLIVSVPVWNGLLALGYIYPVYYIC